MCVCVCVYGSVCLWECVLSVCFRAQFNKLSNILPGEFHKRRNIYECVCIKVCECVCVLPVCACVCVCGWLLLKNVISPCRSRRTYVAGFLLYVIVIGVDVLVVALVAIVAHCCCCPCCYSCCRCCCCSRCRFMCVCCPYAYV